MLAMLRAYFYGVRAGIRTPGKKLRQINQTRNEGCVDNTCKGVGKETESDLGCILKAETIEFADRFYVEVGEKEASNKTRGIFGLT